MSIFLSYIYSIFLACLWYRNTEESCTKLLCGKVVWSDTIWQNLIWSPCWENQTTGRIYVDWIGSVLEVVEFSLMNLLSTEHFNSSLWSKGMWHFFQIGFRKLDCDPCKLPARSTSSLWCVQIYWSQNQGHAQSWRLDHIWLVVYLPLWKILVSWDDEIPEYIGK